MRQHGFYEKGSYIRDCPKPITGITEANTVKRLIPAIGTLGLIGALVSAAPHSTVTQAAHSPRTATVHVVTK
jgi:hypothetical protein